MTSIPFGRGLDRLGYQTFPDSPASQPSAFVVAPDGSLWIDDRWKRRVAHFSGTGRYLGSAQGLDARGWDLALLGERIFVLEEQESGTLGTVRGDRVESVGIAYVDQPLFMVQIVPTVRGLVAQAALVPGSDDGVFGTFLVVRPEAPLEPEILPGLPLGSGDTYVDARLSETTAKGRGDQDFDFTFSSPEVVQVQPIRIELIAPDGPEGKAIPAQVGLREPIPVGDDVLVYVEIAPSRPEDADRFGGGHWLLRLGQSPLLWERIPDPKISSELQHRHLGVGPDGAIYLMVAEEGGVNIYRRPDLGAEGS